MHVRLALGPLRLELDVPLAHVVAGTFGAAAIVAAANLHRRRRAVEELAASPQLEIVADA